MSDQLPILRRSFLLKQLADAPGQKLGKFTASKAKPKELELDKPALDSVVAALIAEGYITAEGKGSARSISLTAGGAEYQKTLPPFPPPPPPPAAPDEKLKCLVLMELAAAGDKRLVPREIAAGITPAIQQTLGLAKSMVTPAMAFLVHQQWADEQPTGKSGKDEKSSYRLTERGKEELAGIPDAIKAVFPHLKPPTAEMKSFVLMEMLAAGDQRLLTAEIEKILAKPAGKNLRLLKQMAGPLLATLKREKLVNEEIAERSGKASYQLTEQGLRDLARGGLHPSASFTLTGKAINELLRHAGGIPQRTTHANETIQDRHPSANSGQKEPAQGRPSIPLSDDALLGEARDLLRERHGHTGLVPIFELRRRVLQKFGERAASHEELDRRLMKLRWEDRVRLVSISDGRRANADELRDSVSGEGETFFYVGNLQ